MMPGNLSKAYLDFKQAVLDIHTHCIGVGSGQITATVEESPELSLHKSYLILESPPKVFFPSSGLAASSQAWFTIITFKSFWALNKLPPLRNNKKIEKSLASHNYSLFLDAKRKQNFNKLNT
jgi:hypothetical protein